MYSQNITQAPPFDPAKISILSILRPKDDPISNFGRNFKENVSFHDFVPFNDEENIVTNVAFDFGITFCPEAPTKVGRIN